MILFYSISAILCMVTILVSGISREKETKQFENSTGFDKSVLIAITVFFILCPLLNTFFSIIGILGVLFFLYRSTKKILVWIFQK